jgi:competence protein ComEC
MDVLLSFVAGVLAWGAFLYFPVSASALILSAAALLYYHKKIGYVILITALGGFCYAWLRDVPPAPADDYTFEVETEVEGVFTSIPHMGQPERMNWAKRAGQWNQGDQADQAGFRQDFLVECHPQDFIAGTDAVDSSGPRLNPLCGKTVRLSFSGVMLAQPYRDEGFVPGSRARLTLNAQSDNPTLNPGMFGDLQRRPPIIRGKALYVWSVQDDGSLKWLPQRLRYRLSRYLEYAFPPEVSGLLQSITIGHTAGMGQEMRTAFMRAGVTHLLSVSGSHFGMLFLIVFAAVKALIHALPMRFLNRLTLYVTPSEAGTIAALPVVTAYLLVSGMDAPSVRSFVMIVLFLAGILLGRKSRWRVGLSLAAFVIVLYEPDAVYSVSFILSFLSVLSIGLAGERIGSYIDKIIKDGTVRHIIEKISILDKNLVTDTAARRVLIPVGGTFSASIAAHFGTLPVVIYVFHNMSIISPVANLVVVPLMGFLVLPLALFSSAVYLAVGIFPFVGALGYVTVMMDDVIRFFASAPWASMGVGAVPFVFVPAAYAVFALLAVGKNRMAAAVFLLLITAFFAQRALERPPSLTVTFLAADRGESHVIETAGGMTIVIDTGLTGREAAAYLRYRGKTVIDALVLTHADDDHSGGFLKLLSEFDVRRVWDNGEIEYPEEVAEYLNRELSGPEFPKPELSGREKLRHLTRGDIVKFDGALVTVLNPVQGEQHGTDAVGINDASMMLRLDGAHSSFLFTADVEESEDTQLAGLGEILHTDVLKVAHHGSRTATSPEFLHAVSPRIAVISPGNQNRFGFPRAEVLQRLESEAVKTYRTDLDGAVRFTDTPAGLEIKTYADSFMRRAESLSDEAANLRRLFSLW